MLNNKDVHDMCILSMQFPKKKPKIYFGPKGFEREEGLIRPCGVCVSVHTAAGGHREMCFWRITFLETSILSF